MPLEFDQHLNRTVLVSIPSLFGDGKCQAYTLRGAGELGLWLESDALTARLLHNADRQTYALNGQAAFVPFEHIAGVFVPTGTPAEQPPPLPTEKPPAPPAAGKAPTTAKTTKVR
jgi:hypothetical protein